MFPPDILLEDPTLDYGNNLTSLRPLTYVKRGDGSPAGKISEKQDLCQIFKIDKLYMISVRYNESPRNIQLINCGKKS
jgi:hypothetical protein